MSGFWFKNSRRLTELEKQTLDQSEPLVMLPAAIPYCQINNRSLGPFPSPQALERPLCAQHLLFCFSSSAHPLCSAVTIMLPHCIPSLSPQTQRTWATLRTKDSSPCIIAEEPSSRPKSTTWSAMSSQQRFSLSPRFALSAMSLSGTILDVFLSSFKICILSLLNTTSSTLREGEGPSTGEWWSMGSPALKRSKEPDSTQGFYNVTLEEGNPLQIESSMS